MIIQVTRGKPMKSHKLQTSEDTAGFTENTKCSGEVFLDVCYRTLIQLAELGNAATAEVRW